MKKTIRTSKLFAICLSIVLLTPSTNFVAADRGVGKWKLNLTKSKYPANKPPTVRKVKWIAIANGNGVKFSSERLGMEGSIEYTASFDGKDYPVKWAAEYETVSLRQINANTVESTYKRNGQVVGISKRVVSTDGTELTITSTGPSAEGEVSDELLFDKE